MPSALLESPQGEPFLRGVTLFGTNIHVVTLEQACAAIFHWIERAESSCRYVVTPNVDHVIQLQQNGLLREAYRSASMTVADGWPIVAASRMLRRPLPERVAGSDLAPALFSKWPLKRRLRVFLLGGASGVPERAAAEIGARFPAVEIAGVFSPPFGFEAREADCDEIVRRINNVRPDVLIVGFGAPKQELWLSRFADRLEVQVALAAGATIDFFAGVQRRAPPWVRRIGMEWFYRFAQEPRRLGGRYLRSAWVFPQLVLKELFQAALGSR